MLSSETLIIVAVALTANTAGSVLFKKGASQRNKSGKTSAIPRLLSFARDMLSSRLIIFGLLLQGIAVIGWLAFISRAALSFAFPLSSISNVFILLASHYFLRERISPRRWGGVMLILGGIALIANS